MRNFKRKSRRTGLILVLLMLMLLVSACAATPAYLLQGAVSYLGPTGTYTEEAAQCIFGEEAVYLPEKTVADAVQQLLDGNSAFAVIPQENTLGGPVYDYVDELLSHEELSVAMSVELPIRQALLAKEGTKLSDITVVYSHRQGITQGAAWLKENLPDAEVVEVSSTAEGAKMVAESDAEDCAAIASTGAAKVYALEVLAENIQQNDANKTRFYVLSTDEPQTEPSDRMTFTATGTAEDLPKLLKRMDHRGMQIVSIHDRPAQTTLGSYVYLIECENADYRDYEKLTKLSEFSFRYYGSFLMITP